MEPENKYALIGAVIREVRIEQGLTQAELAARARVSVAQIQLFERGCSNNHKPLGSPRLSSVLDVASGLGLQASELLSLCEQAWAQQTPLWRQALGKSDTDLAHWQNAAADLREATARIDAVCEQARPEGPRRAVSISKCAAEVALLCAKAMQRIFHD